MSDLNEQEIKNLRKLTAPNRIKILELLYKQDTCVCKMVEKLELKHNLISHHLKILIDMGYLENRRNGQHIMYSLIESKRSFVNKLLALVYK